MRILVTGSGGLVGRNLVENEGMKKHELLCPRSDELDLTDFLKVLEYLEKNKPEMIIHCAGKVGGIQANMMDMFGFFTENLLMGVNLVRAAKEKGVKKLINLASSCAYPKDYINPLKEEYVLKSELEPTNEGYALAKLSVLKMCEYITNECEGFEYKTLIPCNLYGKYDKFGENNSHMIPAVVKKICDAKKNNALEVDIWGDGEARRESMYAGDLADCIFMAIDNLSTLPNVMNVGPGEDYSINEYYEVVKEVVGYDGKFVHDLSKPVGMKQKLLDVSRQTKWGWKPKTSLKEGISETFKFYVETY